MSSDRYPRFFAPNLVANQLVELSPEDSRHACSVLRLEVGSFVELFDGLGGKSLGKIEAISKNSVQIRLHHIQRSIPAQGNSLDLIVALPKGDRQKQLVDQLVQLGTTSLTPLLCERLVAQPTDGAMARLERTVIESCKQCGRNQLMRLQRPSSIGQLIELSHAPNQIFKQPAVNIYAHPDHAAKSLWNLLSDTSTKEPSVRVIVGPEGGLTDQEIGQLSSAGWQSASLGNIILRIETAAVFVAAVWSAMQQRN